MFILSKLEDRNLLNRSRMEDKRMEEEKMTQEKTDSQKKQESEDIAEEDSKPQDSSEPEEKPEEDSKETESERKMYKATCTDCGAECEVPFEPTEGKPVRCQDCFRKNRPRRSFGRRDNFRRERSMHDATCAKCKKNCQVPFKPNGQKPVLCMDCFKKEKGF